MCAISPGFAQEPPGTTPGIEIFGGFSVNTDNVQNRPAILIADQKVSPFFSHGSGPTGFQVSFKRDVRNGLGLKADVSGYSDTFRAGSGTYCQPADTATGIACGSGLTAQATGRALYVTAGPEWKLRRDKRFAPFAQVLAGIVYARSTFTMTGSDVQYSNPFTGGVLLFTTAGFPQDRNVTYSDSNADAGFALDVGGGFDIRLGKQFGFRVAMAYDPTFLTRPGFPDLTPDSQGRVSLSQLSAPDKHRQDHVRLSLGVVWRVR